MTEVELRPMRWRDIETVAPLEQDLFAGDPPWSEEQFRSELAGVPESRWYVVAITGAGVAGYAGLSVPAFPGDPADVLTIAVAPAMQRRGIGSLLLEALEVEACRRGAGELLLEVRADNDPARAFYQHHGFGRIAIRRNYYAGHRDGFVLRKRLPG